MSVQRAPAVLLQKVSASSRAVAVSALQVLLPNSCGAKHGLGEKGAANLGPCQIMWSRRSLTGLDGARLPVSEWVGDARLYLLEIETPMPGSCSREEAARWADTQRECVSSRMRRAPTCRAATASKCW